MNQMEISILIPPTVSGINRKVVWEGFSYWLHAKKEAEMICSIWMIDENQNIINNKDLAQGRIVKIEISNRNKVDNNGVLIDNEEEGIPEYDFYFNNFMLNPTQNPKEVILTALTQLTNFDRWNR